MNTTLLFAIITINLALIFYSIGVWSERISKQLKKTHVFIFWIGLIFDTTGTTLMNRIANSNTSIEVSKTTSLLHGLTGLSAILLMLFHVLWATWVLYKNDEKQKANFHRFSMFVWIIWLVPYFLGVMIGMMK